VNAFVGTAISHDFAFDAHTAANDVVVAGAVLVFVGAIMLVPHATGVVLLAQRGVRGGTPVLRGFNLIALATATIGFLATGGTALAYVLQKITDDEGAGWREYHPGEPLAYALILFPVVCWFAYQLWSDVTRDTISEPVPNP
jgi:hypothetical protein